MRKILHTCRYGAGWSTLMSKIPSKFACEYQPIIEAVEREEDLTEDHPAVQQFVQECKDKFDEEPYVSGAKNLIIFECPDDCVVKITEFDGCEHVDMKSKEYF